MNDKIKHLIANLLIEQGQLKVLLRNLVIIEQLTEDKQNDILDEIEDIERLIQKLKKGMS
jgi:hypothetical protein